MFLPILMWNLPPSYKKENLWNQEEIILRLQGSNLFATLLGVNFLNIFILFWHHYLFLLQSDWIRWSLGSNLILLLRARNCIIFSEEMANENDDFTFCRVSFSFICFICSWVFAGFRFSSLCLQNLIWSMYICFQPFKKQFVWCLGSLLLHLIL